MFDLHQELMQWLFLALGENRYGPRTNIYFFSLSALTGEPLSATKVITFLP